MFKSIDPKELTLPEIHNYMLSSVSPRPIALASSIDNEGNINLAPFSQFNVFSTNPPILIFSASINGRTGKKKNTLENIEQTKEVCINIVEYDMIYQTSFASSEFDKGINEFDKANFTAIKSDIIKPPRVGESPVNFECKVENIVSLGTEGGAGNLIICRVVKIHVHNRVLDSDQKIDPLKINQVARCGGVYYLPTEPNKLFSIQQPQGNLGIGVDSLSDNIRNSKVLTGNNLGMLALAKNIPSNQEIEEYKKTQTFLYFSNFDGEEKKFQIHRAAQEMLNNGNISQAITLLYCD